MFISTRVVAVIVVAVIVTMGRSNEDVKQQKDDETRKDSHSNHLPIIMCESVRQCVKEDIAQKPTGCQCLAQRKRIQSCLW